MCAVTVHIAHKFLESVFGMEHLLAGLALVVGSQIGECDADAGIEIGQLAHTAGNDIPLEHGGGEYRGVRPELLSRAAFIGLSDHLDRIEGLALLVFLLVSLAVAEHL